MNRQRYFNYIEEKLNVLSQRIKTRGKINMLELNLHSETFFANLLNILLDLKLVNLNTIEQNIEAIDLFDNENKVIAQVSATSTKRKIDDCFKKEIFSEYKNHTFKFISIANEASKLRKNTYIIPLNIIFSPETDIIDTAMILGIISGLNIEKQESLYELVKKELGAEIDILKVDTNLANIINILANENLYNTIECSEVNSFEIEKKIDFNMLSDVKETINDYKIYYSILEGIYTVLDEGGVNKSFSVLQTIKNQYIKEQNKNIASKEIFYLVIERIMKIISDSKNFSKIHFEELELCVYIIVVDAFVRCKIFKNPKGYNHVIT